MKIFFGLTLLLLSFVPAFSQEEVVHVLQQSLPTIADSDRYVDVLNRISTLSYEQNSDSTLFYANQARDIGRRTGYKKGIADATNNLAIYFDINGNTDLALRYYSDAYKQYTGLQDTSNLAQMLMNIAMVYHTTGNDQKAMNHYRQAMALGVTLREDSILSLVIYNFVLQYPDQFAPDSVDLYIKKAIRIGQKYHDTRLLLAIDQLKANRFIREGYQAAGIQLLEHALSEGLRSKLFFMSLDILNGLGDLYSKSDSAKAVSFYLQALDIAKQRRYTSYEMDLTQTLYDFYILRKDKTRAYGYSMALIQLYRKKQEIENRSGIDYITYALKDQQLETIQEKAVYAHRLLWLEGIACVLAAAIIFMLWRNGRQNKRIHATLEEQYKELAVTTAALEKSNKNYAHLIRVVAHDLRNPIGAISSISGLMVDTPSPTKDKEALRLIVKASNTCLQLITELLETDLEVTRETLHKEAVDVNALLQHSAQLLAYRALEKKQQLIAEEATGQFIAADKNKLARVLDNLVVNAIKFSPEGATIKLHSKGTLTGATISVHDNGVGVPPEIAGKLFEPFESSIRRNGTSGEQSYGLGLYICRQIVEAHGGRIWFESQPGLGSTFFISLQK